MVRSLWFFYVFLCASLCATAQSVEQLPFTKGVYGDPQPLLRTAGTFGSLGINAIFVRSTSLNDELFKTAKMEGVRVYVEFPTLNGKEYLEDHPEAWPINEKGEQAPAADWFMGICLTDTGFMDYREAQLRTILEAYPVDGVWLDYLHWHAQFETPDPILPETCFCDRCILLFSKESATKIPEGDVATKAQWILMNSDSSWRAWRSDILVRWVRNMKSVLEEVRPRALLGIYHCPWYPSDFGGALYRTLGLDMRTLSRIADVLSPMLYHRMMDRSTEWVGEYVLWLDSAVVAKRRRPLIWPIVQAHNLPDVVSIEEFRSVMWNGSRHPATGVMMFTAQTLMGEPAKLEVMKDLYRKR